MHHEHCLFYWLFLGAITFQYLIYYYESDFKMNEMKTWIKKFGKIIYFIMIGFQVYNIYHIMSILFFK